MNDNPTFAELDFEYSVGDQVFDDDLSRLGRVLFYDKNLSLNAEVSCGSCHKQEFGFADNVKKSTGFLDGPTLRNTSNLIDIKDKQAFFWDGRSSSLPDAVTRPIVDEREMGMNPSKLVKRLSKLKFYEDLFRDAYGDKEVTTTRISIALAEFVGSIISTEAKIDQITKGLLEPSEIEEQGMVTFRKHCNSCHEVFAAPQDEVLLPYYGRPSNTVDIGLPLDNDHSSFSLISGKFILVPSLKNIVSTAPYMHDGRFVTLREVVDHYNEGIQDRRTVDPRLQDKDGKPQRLELTESEIEALISFLQTMWDPTVEQSPRFSDPFVQ